MSQGASEISHHTYHTHSVVVVMHLPPHHTPYMGVGGCCGRVVSRTVVWIRALGGMLKKDCPITSGEARFWLRR